MFIQSADELYGPISTIRRDGRVICILWTKFALSMKDWESVNDTYSIISDANEVQHLFPDESRATLWCAIPEIEELLTAWEKKLQIPRYSIYKNTIRDGIDKISKYYNCFDDKHVYVLALVLHPYYKLDYIKMAWGGAEEQAKEIADGNRHAKNWHDEALKVFEDTIREYWQDAMSSKVTEKHGTADNVPNNNATDTLASEFERHHHILLEKASNSGSNLGWAAELWHYLDDLPHDVSKNMDIVIWWAKKGIAYPTLARIAQDICAIPVSSVPCEHLFSAGAEIATDRRSHLGADRFEELQILKHAWHMDIID